jgi:hypothetical protein
MSDNKRPEHKNTRLFSLTSNIERILKTSGAVAQAINIQYERDEMSIPQIEILVHDENFKILEKFLPYQPGKRNNQKIQYSNKHGEYTILLREKTMADI